MIYHVKFIKFINFMPTCYNHLVYSHKPVSLVFCFLFFFVTCCIKHKI